VIWAILALLGIPLWLLIVLLAVLLRTRSKIRKVPGSFEFKVRVPPGGQPVLDLKNRFARYVSVGHWVHDVLVVHGGSPFLLRTAALGIEGVDTVPADADPDREPGLKRMSTPQLVRLGIDGGAVVELACAKDDLPALLGPFPTESVS
jgi:hypothetical protein